MQKEERVKILENNLQIKNDIMAFIKLKNMITNTKTDIHSPVILGGIRFWFSIKTDDNSIFFNYDKHPKDWDIESIKRDLYQISHEYYLKTGRTY